MPETFEIVEADRFDRRARDEMYDLSATMRKAVREIESASPRGRDLAGDVWSSLIRFNPARRDAPPSHRVNATVIDRLWQAEEFRDVKAHTVGDPVNTMSGVCALTSSVTGMLGDLADVQEQADRAQAAQDALEEAMASDGQGGDQPGDQPGGDIEALRSTAEAEAELLDRMLDDRLPQIDQAVRAAATEAAEQAEADAELATGWSLDGGEDSRMDPADRIRMMGRLDTDRMRRLAALMGAIHAFAMGARDRKFTLLPGELHGVTLGNSLPRLIPAEFAAFAVPELEDLMLLRLITDRARIYETRTIERAGRGAVIYLEDQSGSMDGPKGDWSKCFGLTLLKIARAEGRAFHAFCFRGKGKWTRFDFPDPTEQVTDRMIDFASTEPQGGTDIVGPLDEAVALLDAEYVNDGNVEGDIVLATDGELSVPPEWLAEFKATQARLEFNVYGLGIAAKISTLNMLCTHVADVTDLTSGRDVEHVFEAVH